MAAPPSPGRDPYFSPEGEDAKKGARQARTQTGLKPSIAYLCPSSTVVCMAFWAMFVPEARIQAASPMGFLRGLGLALGMSLEVLAIVMTMLNTLILFGVIRQP